MIKKILVPTDFSLTASNAIHYALELSKIFNTEMILYHSFIPFESGFYASIQSKKENIVTEKKLTNQLTKTKNQIQKLNNKITISVYVDRGPENIQLIKFCKKNKVDLIVMGTNEVSGIKEILIGSFTSEVMTNAPCFVLAIPKKYKFKFPKIITYASNYSRKDNLVLQSILDINSFFNAKLNVIHIDIIDDYKETTKAFNKYKTKIENSFIDIEISFQHIKGEDIVDNILSTTLTNKTDFLILNPIRKKGIWNQLFQKSISKTICYHIKIPLLTIPIK